MPSHPFFKPFLSRAISAHPNPPNLSPQEFTQHYLALLATLSRSPNHPKTLSSLDSLLAAHSGLLDANASLLVLRGLALLRKLTRAKSFLASLKQQDTIPTFFLYSTLLQCTLRHGTIRDVEAAWSDLDRSVTISDFVIYMCRHCDDAAEIDRIYWRISSSGWRVSREAYVAVIGAMCRINDPDRHLGRIVLNEMAGRGMEADDLSYFAVFQSFCRAGNVLEADSVLRDWRNRREFELDVSIYGSFFYGLCKSDKFREAGKLFDKLTTRVHSDQIVVNSSPLLKPRRRAIFQLTYPGIISEIIAFEAYFRGLCGFGRVDEGERLLKKAMKKSTVPEVCVHNCFIKALFRVGRASDALRFFESERKKGHVSARDITVAVIFGLCENARVLDACKLLNEIICEGFVPTARVWNRIIKSYLEMGSEEKAMEMFEKMRYESCDIYQTQPDSETYSMMIAKFLEKGEVQISISLLDELVGKKFKAGVDLYSGIVRGLHKCGRVDESRKWLNLMIEKGILVSYEGWESLYDSVTMEGELWKAMEANYNEAKESEKRRVKGKNEINGSCLLY